MNETQRTSWWKKLARDHPEFQQFGDGQNASTAGGKRGCTQTVLRFLAFGWTGRKYTQDDVSRMSGYPTLAQKQRGTGMTAGQCRTFFAAAKMPYRVVSFDHPIDPFYLMRIANAYGPVAIGVAYSHQPQMKGASYLGVKADGKPNGYAINNGKTQLSGFTGSHMDCVLGYYVIRDAQKRIVDRIVACKDPNHGSVIRPERPAYDTMHQSQFIALYQSFQVLGRPLYAIVPTEVFHGPG